MSVELMTFHENKAYYPVLNRKIKWSTERSGVPGELNFSLIADPSIIIEEGDAVRFIVDGIKIFYGFVFTKSIKSDNVIDVIAYDQIRYLKNKDTYVYKNKTATDLIKMIANDFRLNVGELDPTAYVIPSRVEDNTSLIDMIQTALDLTLQNKGEMMVLYDDFGKLTLKALSNMVVGTIIDKDVCKDFSYKSSIDSSTYNKIKLVTESKDEGSREVYIAQDSNNLNKWGILQYFDTLKEKENGKSKCEELLKYYNQRTRSISFKGVFGNLKVRAGSMVLVKLNVDKLKINNLMLVEKCTHSFDDEHTMDLTLKGGEFVV